MRSLILILAFVVSAAIFGHCAESEAITPRSKAVYILISTNESFEDKKENHLIPENQAGLVSKIAAKLLTSDTQKCVVYLWSAYPVVILDAYKQPIAGYYFYPAAKPGPVFVRMKVVQVKDVIKLFKRDHPDHKGIVFEEFQELVKPWVTLD